MKLTQRTLSLSLGLTLFLQLSRSGLAAELSLHAVPKDPPTDLDDSIRKTLKSTAIQLVEGNKPAFEFWLSAEIALASKPDSPAKTLDMIKQGTLLGAVAVQGDVRDYKDNDLPRGVYSMRFGLQPQDGNHLGTADYTYFAVLVQAKNDPKLEAIADYKALVRASSKGTSSDHPIILSIRPASSAEGEGSKLNEPAPEHKSVRLKIPARVAGSSDKLDVIFELVYQGKGKL